MEEKKNISLDELQEMGLDIVEDCRTFVVNCEFTDNLTSSMYEFVTNLAYYDDMDEQPPVHIHITSGGGCATSLFSIIDILSNVDAPIYTYANGICASAALALFVVGEKRVCGEYCDLLYHSVQYTVNDPCNAVEHRKVEKDMKKLTDKYNSVFLKNTKLTEKDLRKYYGKDWWFDKETALKYGIATE